MTSIALVAVRAAVVLGAALAAMRLMGRTSAATRRSLLVGAFAIVLFACCSPVHQSYQSLTGGRDTARDVCPAVTTGAAIKLSPSRY